MQGYWAREEPYRFVPVMEISEAFLASKWGRASAQALEQPFERNDFTDSCLVTQKYALGGESYASRCCCCPSSSL